MLKFLFLKIKNNIIKLTIEKNIYINSFYLFKYDEYN